MLLIRFHTQNPCIIISIIQSFLARFAQKMSLTKLKLFSVISVIFGFTLNVTILIICRYLQNSNESWCCIECCSTICPFNSISINRNFLARCANSDNNTTQWIDLENDHNSSLSLKRSSNLELLVNQSNNAIPNA